jgi:N-acetylglucosamine kinase-like BadF-type ATPase
VRSNKNRQGWIIGIDGGGTKTQAAIGDLSGHVAAVATGDSANPLSRPWADVEETIRGLIQELLKRANIGKEEVDALYIGLGGADRPAVSSKIESAFAREWQGRLFIDNDAVAALYSGTWGKPGVVLIAGTGSIAYAVDHNNRRYRVGGWGYLLGDEGSGYDLGRQGAIAVLRAFDGRGEATLLTSLMLAHYGLAAPDELIAQIYGSENPRKELGVCSRIVEHAANQGDAVAMNIISHSAHSLVEMVEACHAKLGEALPVVLAGGLLTTETRMRQELRKIASFAMCTPTVPPVIGALVAGMRRVGHQLDQEGIRQLQLSQGDGEGSNVDE